VTDNLTPANYDSIRRQLFDRIHKTGEQVKNDLPNKLRFAIDHKAWKQFSRADGTPFENISEWIVTPFPIGLGAGQDRLVLSWEDILKLTECAPDVHEVLLGNPPPKRKPKPGSKLYPSTGIVLERGHSSSRIALLSIHLKTQYPKYYEAYMRGEYKSVTAAATAAGLLKDNVNLRRLKSAWRKATKTERKQFEEWKKQPD